MHHILNAALSGSQGVSWGDCDNLCCVSRHSFCKGVGVGCMARGERTCASSEEKGQQHTGRNERR